MLYRTGARQPRRVPDLVRGMVVRLPVLVVGQLRPDLGVSGVHEGVAVADCRHPDAVQDAIRRLSGPDRDPVLTVCSESDLPRVRADLAILSVGLPDTRLLLEPIPGTPLATSVAATLAAGAQTAASQLAVLDQLREHMWSAVWLRRLTKLAAPAPSLAQHVRSWLPGPGFLAVASPHARVVPATPGIPAELGAPAGGTVMVAATGGPDWLVPELLTATGTREAVHLAHWRDPRDAYGVTDAVDVVVVPSTLAGIDAPEEFGRTECPSCLRRHDRATCPFCKMTTDPFHHDRGAHS